MIVRTVFLLPLTVVMAVIGGCRSAPVATAPLPALPTPDPLARPMTTASEPANGRELPPGKTVTLIPASSGPSITVEETDEFPTLWRGTYDGWRGGSGPQGRRPGIGIAVFPRTPWR